MKQLYLLLITFFIFNYSLFSKDKEGYIVTKDAKIITGQVEAIFYSEWISEITFINEMGTKYVFQPWLIYGFAYDNGNGLEKYESKFEKGHWRFLKIIVKGEELSLYGCPPQKTKQVREIWGVTKVILNTNEYWLEPKEKYPIRIFPANFKRKMKKFLNDEPEMVEKLGKLGYRYTDLPKIVKEFNNLRKDETIRI